MWIDEETGEEEKYVAEGSGSTTIIIVVVVVLVVLILVGVALTLWARRTGRCCFAPKPQSVPNSPIIKVGSAIPGRDPEDMYIDNPLEKPLKADEEKPSPNPGLNPKFQRPTDL